MYEKTEYKIILSDFEFPYGKLDPNNRWVKMSNVIPWLELEEIYSKNFNNKGNRAKGVRIALGSLIIKQILKCSDVDTVEHIIENPYLQYFIGLKAFTDKAPFSPQSMTEFRKRFGDAEIMAAINNKIIPDDVQRDDSLNEDSNQGELVIGEAPFQEEELKDSDECREEESKIVSNENVENKGVIAIDATCAPASISFPQDIKLLNEAREKTERLIDELRPFYTEKKPRTYRCKARKDFLLISKSKKRTAKFMRKGIKKQLNYLKRNFSSIEKMIEGSKRELTEKQKKLLEILKQVYTQQQEMITKRTHSVENRIVSISQPHIRPMPRGKAKMKTEFGSKVEIAVINGYVRLETLKFDAYNEAKNLIEIIERYRKRNGCYPKKVLVDKLYRNRENLNYCKEHGIRITGPALGRPKKDAVVDKNEEYQDICDRNCVEGKFGEGKTTYGLDRISARLKETSIAVIGVIFMVINLKKKVRLSFAKILEFIFSNFFQKKNLPNKFLDLHGRFC